MAVRLTKGQKVNLRKDNPNLKRVLVGLGWDPVNQKGSMKKSIIFWLWYLNQVLSGWEIDVDASVICIDGKGQHVKTVYYGARKYHKGAIKHYGDNLTGEGEEGEDDEQIEIKLDEIPQKVQKLSIIINIFSAYEKMQTFKWIRNCYVHVTDMDSGKELVRYDIDGEFSGKTGIFVADLERSGTDWHFTAIGEGVKVADISEMVRMKCSVE